MIPGCRGEPQTSVSALPDSLKNKEGELLTTDAQQLLEDAFGSYHEPGALMDLTNGHFGELIDKVTSADLTPLEDDTEGPGLIPLDDTGYAGIFSKRDNFRVPGTSYIIQDFNNEAGGHDRLVQVLEAETVNGREVYGYRASLQFGPYGKGTGKSQVVASVAIPPESYKTSGMADVQNTQNAVGKNVPKDGWTEWQAHSLTPTDFLRTNGDANGPKGHFYQQVRMTVTERTGMASTAVVLPTGATS